MGQKRRMRVRKRKKHIAETWDFLATKSLIAGEPSKLCSDVRTTLKMLNIPWSTKNRERYLAAMRRAVGAKACEPIALRLNYAGSRSGRWSSCAPKYTSTLENLRKQIYSMTGIPQELLTTNFSETEARVRAQQDIWQKKYSELLDSSFSAAMLYGTSTLLSKDGQLLQVMPHELGGRQPDDRSECEAVAPTSAPEAGGSGLL